MNIPRLLLHGAIRKDVGNGHVFYDALRAASREQLQVALDKLESNRRYSWTYPGTRAREIRKRIDEKE